MTYHAEFPTARPASAADPTPSVQVDWAAVLHPGEPILWLGRPDGRAFLTLGQVARFARTVVAIGLFFYILDRLWLQIPPLWDVRMIVLFIFFQAVPAEVLLSVLRRRRTYYALTPHRLLIAVRVPLTGIQIRSVPILRDTPLDLVQGARLGSIRLAVPKRPFWDLRPGLVPPGFERIKDAGKVFLTIEQVQRAQT